MVFCYESVMYNTCVTAKDVFHQVQSGATQLNSAAFLYLCCCSQ